MIENKEIPTKDFINIKHVWLRQIDRCNEAISQRFMKDVQDKICEMSGVQYVVESVSALHISLIDWGDAPIKTDVDNWVETVYRTAKDKNKILKWAKLKFEFILSRMNRYGLLYDVEPKGYTNVVMKSVE